MKLRPECIACQVDRVKGECDLVFNEDADKLLVLREFIAYLLEHLEPSDPKNPPFLVLHANGYYRGAVA